MEDEWTRKGPRAHETTGSTSDTDNSPRRQEDEDPGIPGFQRGGLGLQGGLVAPKAQRELVEQQPVLFVYQAASDQAWWGWLRVYGFEVALKRRRWFAPRSVTEVRVEG